MISDLTPEVLRKHEFKYSACGISGADMWQGMSFWYNKERDVMLRGNCSTARPGGLKLAGYYNSSIDTEEQLIFLMNILNSR